MNELYSNLGADTAKTYEADGREFNMFPGPGIIENNVISSVSIEETKDKSAKYLKFVFKNLDTDATLNHMEFAVTDPSGTKTKEQLVKKLDSQMTRLKHIVSKFYGDSIPRYGTFEAIRNGVTSFDEFITRIVALLPANVLATKKFRIFVSYNYNDFLSLPPFVPFMEDGALPVEGSKFIAAINKTLKNTTMYTMEKTKNKTSNPANLDFGGLNAPVTQEFAIPSSLPTDTLPF